MSSALDEMLPRLDELDAQLRDARSRILEFLDWQKQHEVRLLKIPLFAVVCDAIYEAAKAFHNTARGWLGEEEEGGKEKNEDFAFYLWPGYESLTKDADGSRRVDLRVPIQCLPEGLRGKDDAYASIECGISPAYNMGTVQAAASDDATRRLLSEIQKVMAFREENLGGDFPSDVREAIRKDPNRHPGSLHGIVQPTDHADNILFRIMGNPCSLGFWAFLAKRETNLFEVGSTHRWLSHERPRYQSQGSAAIGGRRIRGVTFRVVESDEQIKQKPSAGESHGFLKVWLKQESRSSWGPDASSRIKNEVGSMWPRLVPGSGVYPNLDRALDLYSLWLQTVYLGGRTGARDPSDTIQQPPEPEKFFCERAMEYGKWYDAFRRTYPQIADYVLSKSRYEYWYSLALDESVSESDTDVRGGRADKQAGSSLGSLMLFSARRLHPAFLSILRQWAESLYMLLREVERAALNRRAGNFEGVEQTLWAQSHELSSELSSINRRLVAHNSWRHIDKWRKRFPKEVPFLTVWAPPIVISQLAYLANWLDRWAGIPNTLEGTPTIEAFFRALFENATPIAAALSVRDVVIDEQNSNSISSLLRERANWLANCFSFECSVRARLAEPLYAGSTNRAAVAATRIFNAAFHNAAKHLFNEEKSLRDALRATLSIHQRSDNAITLTIRNEFAADRRSAQDKDNGTANTLLALGSPFGVTPSSLVFRQDPKGLRVWITEITMQTTFRTGIDTFEPWISIG